MTTSNLFSNANRRSRFASLKGAFVAVFVVALSAGFLAQAVQSHASSEARALVALQ